MNREKLLMTVAAAAFALLVLDKAVLGPLMKKWDSNSRKIGFLTEDVTKGRSLLKRERSLRDRWEEMRELAMPVERAESESKVLTRIDQWSRSARLDISQINPNWRDEEDHAKFVCRLEANGDMESVTRFLHDLDGEELGIRVETLELVSRDKSGRRLGVDLTMSALELPQEKEERR